ncbi:MAG TPA: hypothetical protein VF508_06620, partial [Pyrinomonadaceae bacterium]
DMLSLLLKKALPFTLTLVVGSALGWVFRPSPPAATVWVWPEHSTPLLGREGPFGEPRWRSHEHCRARRHRLVAESRPLAILFKPDARWPKDLNRDLPWGDAKENYVFPGARVRVTFGADGKVQRVEPGDELYPALGRKAGEVVRKRMERAAWQIQFEPETVDGVPVTVTRDVEIHFLND